jgi:hypothetical protein
VILSFLAGFVVALLCIFGLAGLACAFITAAWRDGILRHLNGGGEG